MAEQLFTFELDKLSEARQGASMRNCYLKFSDSGNARLQLGTMPMLDTEQAWSQALPGRVLSVSRCYQWIIIHGADGGRNFVKAYDTEGKTMKDVFTPADEGWQAYDKANYFIAKPFWTLAASNGENERIAILINRKLYAFDKSLSRKDPVEIHGVLHYLDISMKEMGTLSHLVSYADTANVQQIGWSNGIGPLGVEIADEDNPSLNDRSLLTLLWYSWEMMSRHKPDNSDSSSITMSQMMRSQMNDFDRWLSNVDSGSPRSKKDGTSRNEHNGYFYAGGSSANDYRDTAKGWLGRSDIGPWLPSDWADALPNLGVNVYLRNADFTRDIFARTFTPHFDNLRNISIGLQVTFGQFNELVRIIDAIITQKPSDSMNSNAELAGGSEHGLKPPWHIYEKRSSIDEISEKDSVRQQLAFWPISYYASNINYQGHVHSVRDVYPVLDHEQNWGPISKRFVSSLESIKNWVNKLAGDANVGGTGRTSIRQIAQANVDAVGAMSRALDSMQDAMNEIAGYAAEKFPDHPDAGDLESLKNSLEERALEFRKALQALSSFATPLTGNADVKASEVSGKATEGKDFVKALEKPWNGIEAIVGQVSEKIKDHKADYDALFFEVLSSMLIIIATDNRFYYSDAGTINVEGISFYAAQSGGGQSTPRECYRLGNRLCLLTDDTVEFWDTSLDFEDPLSPQYSHNVYSYSVIRDSVVVIDDTIYCLASSNALPYRSVYKITKNGEMQMISYPELDHLINSKPLKSVKASLVELSKMPVVQFFIDDIVLNYSMILNHYFLSDEILLHIDRDASSYVRWNGNETGTLTKRDGTIAQIDFPNANFDRSQKNLKLVAVDLDNKGAEKLGIVMDRQKGHAFSTTRSVAFKPGNQRNMLAKVENWGMINDNQMSLLWKGDIDINKARWVIE